MGRSQLTILLAARNAAATIQRAVSSCVAEPGCRIVLADDHSSDDTVARARAAGLGRLAVVRTPDPGGVAMARQAALDAVETPYAAWLDADDEWMPGRADRLVGMLAAGCDVATEAIDLHDGPSGAWLRRLAVPEFLTRPGGFVRIFERNLLPGDTQVGFRASAVRQAGGYDPALAGPESYDVLLRVLRRGGRLVAGPDAGYRMYAYPGSLSRDLNRQRTHLAAVLRKHAYGDLRRLYRAAGFSARIAAWAVVCVAQYRNDHATALAVLDEACPPDSNPHEVLEPEGPWPLREGWRRAFHAGAILLALGGHDRAAAECLQRAEAIEPTAEGANNLGVALARLRRQREAAGWFTAAAGRFPEYVDAAVNLRSPAPGRITTHPLRRTASRHEYALAAAPRLAEPVLPGLP